MPAAADWDRAASSSLTCEPSNFIAHFPTLRSVTNCSLNHIALGRAVFLSPIILSSTLLLLDIQLASNANDNLNSGGLLGEHGHRHQPSLAHCRLFSVDVLPPLPPCNNNSTKPGNNLCCRGLDVLSTFSWFAPQSPLLPQIPTEIAEARYPIRTFTLIFLLPPHALPACLALLCQR